MDYEYVTEGTDYPEEAVQFDSIWTASSSANFVAEDAAKDFYDDDPNPDDFPLKLTIYSNKQNVGTFEVFLEFEPSFSAVAVGEQDESSY